MAHATLRAKTIGAIGAGNMGAAILRGLRAAGVPASRLLALDAKTAAVRRLRGVARPAQSLAALAQASDVILLAVKPQDVGRVLEALRGLLAKRAAKPLVISIAAGVRISALERRLGRGVPVVRVMPNLAATVGASVSVLAAGRWATHAHRALASAIMNSVGVVVETPERDFDIVTAVSGSGPAYFFVIFDALQRAGMRAGLQREAARLLVLQTALGSVKLAGASTEEFTALIARVASKRGTTEAALKVFARRKLAETLAAGVAAAARRSRELSRWLSSTK